MLHSSIHLQRRLGNGLLGGLTAELTQANSPKAALIQIFIAYLQICCSASFPPAAPCCYSHPAQRLPCPGLPGAPFPKEIVAGKAKNKHCMPQRKMEITEERLGALGTGTSCPARSRNPARLFRVDTVLEL